MAIEVTCTCGKLLRAKDEHVGKRAKCPSCGNVWVLEKPKVEEPFIPELPLVEEDTPSGQLASAPSRKTEAASSQARPEEPSPEVPKKPRRKKSKKRKSRRSRASLEPSWRNSSYWLLLLAFIPLGFGWLEKGETLEQRFEQTLEKYPPKERERLEQQYQNKLDERDEKAPYLTPEEFLDLLPDHRFEGSLLPRQTWMHWLFAGISAAVFFGLLMVIFPRKAVPSWHLLLIGVFTATLGIFFLLAVQWIAIFTLGRWIVGGGIWMVIFLFLKIIGFSYIAALNPNTNFLLSFLGFTFGVGLCEEYCKAYPVIRHFRGGRSTLTWQGACLWGMASGIGFGVSEGITYCSDYYNGILPASAYIIRFVSCVGLHAVWSGAVGIMVYNQQAMFDGMLAWWELVIPTLLVLGVPMVLHGLYDTLLKKDMEALALLVALVSFGWLFWLIWKMRSLGDDEPEPEDAVI